MGSESIVNFITFGKIFGLNNLAFFYGKKWDSRSFPFSLPVFGMVSHKEELLNIRDNILQGSIRDGYVERQIGRADQPVIVDCGINVGVTVRWWFYLNPQATVYGIEMMQEAHDFTMKSLADRFKKRYMPITAVLASETGRKFELNFNDPLFGGNSVDAAGQYSGSRSVTGVTLDDCLRDYNTDSIELLKVDIEDSAAEMFRGASETLLKAKNILLEIHSEKEREDSMRILGENGFRIRRAYKRHVWLNRQERI